MKMRNLSLIYFTLFFIINMKLKLKTNKNLSLGLVVSYFC